MSNKKAKKDPRHSKRQQVIKELFRWSFYPNQNLSENSKKILRKTEKIDKEISYSAPKWPLEKINKIDLAILRLATYELLYRHEVPAKVAINEAVELAKEYGGENSSSFINGVLGDIYGRLKNKNEKKS